MSGKEMTPVEALRFALDQEEKAYALYSGFAKQVAQDSTKKMFQFLAGEEAKHIKLIKDELDTGAYQDM